MSKLKDIIEEGSIEMYLNTDISIIKRSLQEEGVDIEKEGKQIEQFVKRIKFTNKAQAHSKKTTELINKLVTQFSEGIERDLEKPIATIKRLIAEKEMQVQFRNLDNLTPEEIKEIIKGKNLVDLMDELDNDDSDNI